MTARVRSLRHLRAGGVSLVLDLSDGGLPAVRFWGADLGEVSTADLDSLAMMVDPPVGDNRIDVPVRVSILPQPAEGWVGRPGVTGSRAGKDFSPLFEVDSSSDVEPDASVADGLTVRASDPVAEFGLEIDIQLMHSGLVRSRATVRNTGITGYQLDGLQLALPLPNLAREVFDLTGRHTRERSPQRRELTVGVHVRESRQGRPGLDSPYLLAVGEPGFGWESGQIWSMHTGWSGNQTIFAERQYNGQQTIGAGELLLPGEIRLAPKQEYRSPWIYASYGVGLNQVSQRFHRYLRSRPNHPRTERKVLINTWEAVYYDHDLARLTELAEAAAEAGVERFVLDDGWFRGRRHDRAGLGDWQVDPDIWPDGLKPLIDLVHELKMDFGLWVEPEMISLDSDLARSHPDWILRAGGRQGIATRQQYVLNLGNPDAYSYISDCLHALLDEYEIAYFKWDHNRTVVEAGDSLTGRPGVHENTLAVYRLMDELRERHPGLEIEACAGGGGRIDLEIIDRTDRTWPSDCIDALDRQQIQRYTQLLLPPELVGTHLGDAESHTTRRRHHLGFRAATAIWGHMGIEWDLTTASAGKRKQVQSWVALHQRLRELLHSGDVYVMDHPDPTVWVNGVVATDKSEAVYGITTVARSVTFPLGQVRLAGLDPDRTYQVHPLPPGDRFPGAHQYPAWWEAGVTAPGRVLACVGLQLPAMFPEYTHLIGVTATPR